MFFLSIVTIDSEISLINNSCRQGSVEPNIYAINNHTENGDLGSVIYSDIHGLEVK